MKKYYIFLNLGPAAGPAQAYTIVLQLPIIETRAEVLLGLARVDGGDSLNFWYNTPGTYFTDNDFSSYFILNSNVSSNTGLAVEPFIRVYNKYVEKWC